MAEPCAFVYIVLYLNFTVKNEKIAKIYFLCCSYLDFQPRVYSVYLSLEKMCSMQVLAESEYFTQFCVVLKKITHPAPF